MMSQWRLQFVPHHYVQYSFEYGRETMLKEKKRELDEGVITEERYNELVALIG